MEIEVYYDQRRNRIVLVDRFTYSTAIVWQEQFFWIYNRAKKAPNHYAYLGVL